MQRRAYLAALAGLGVAGCSSNDEATASAPRSSGTTTSTPTATNPTTPTAELTTEPSETEKDTPEDTDTDTPEADTPDPGSDARPHVQAVETAVKAGYDAYVSQGDGTDLLGVTAQATEFSRIDVNDAFDDAELPLQRARANGPTDEQSRRLDVLERWIDILETLARAQSNVAKAYDRSSGVFDAVLGGDLNTLDSVADTLSDRADTATDVVNEADEMLSEGSGEATDYLTHDQLVAKMDQLRQEASALGAMGEGYSEVAAGFRTYDSAKSSYDTENWREARTEFSDAADQFVNANDTFDEISPPESVSDRMGDILDVTDALESGTFDYANAAAAQADGSETLAEQNVRSAYREFDSAGLEDNEIL